ncbi:MAG: archease [Thermoproteota archaeon]|jgi:SHS2 domain-containing protein|nr:archease [Thermoproteota archaeon]
MCKGEFRYVDHVSDIMVEAFGQSLSQAFEQSALALINIMCDVSKVHPQTSTTIKVSGFDKKSLLYNWLESVLLALLVDRLVLAEFNINIREQQGPIRLDAICKGEPFIPKKHDYRVEVKAITYHEMGISKRRGGKWAIRFIVDL